MSCFIVDDKVIDKVIDLCRLFRPGLSYDLESPDGRLKFGRDLLAMNNRAYAARYTTSPSEEDSDPPEYVYRGKHFLTPMEHADLCGHYKALRCFLYQCSEGKVDEEPLYRKLEETSNGIALHIVLHLPEYQAADWG